MGSDMIRCVLFGGDARGVGSLVTTALEPVPFFYLTRTNFKLGKVCPKEGTRVRVLGVYHDTA